MNVFTGSMLDGWVTKNIRQKLKEIDVTIEKIRLEKQIISMTKKNTWMIDNWECTHNLSGIDQSIYAAQWNQSEPFTKILSTAPLLTDCGQISLRIKILQKYDIFFSTTSVVKYMSQFENPF